MGVRHTKKIFMSIIGKKVRNIFHSKNFIVFKITLLCSIVLNNSENHEESTKKKHFLFEKLSSLSWCVVKLQKHLRDSVFCRFSFPLKQVAWIFVFGKFCQVCHLGQWELDLQGVLMSQALAPLGRSIINILFYM